VQRQIIYLGAIPQDIDLLLTNKHAMIGSGWIAQATMGTGTLFYGLGCTPTSPAGMTVNVAPGCVFSQQNIDNNAYGSLDADTSDQIIKVGISPNTQNFSCPAPVTAGQSVVYLVQAAFSEVDGGATALPYYNAANPAMPYAGPNRPPPERTSRPRQIPASLDCGRSRWRTGRRASHPVTSRKCRARLS
jgi:hypothetical protein